jgi:hypothetical protein
MIVFDAREAAAIADGAFGENPVFTLGQLFSDCFEIRN